MKREISIKFICYYAERTKNDRKVQEWEIPQKTELVLFTRRYKISELLNSVLSGTELCTTETALLLVEKSS